MTQDHILILCLIRGRRHTFGQLRKAMEVLTFEAVQNAIVWLKQAGYISLKKGSFVLTHKGERLTTRFVLIEYKNQLPQLGEVVGVYF